MTPATAAAAAAAMVSGPQLSLDDGSATVRGSAEAASLSPALPESTAAGGATTAAAHVLHCAWRGYFVLESSRPLQQQQEQQQDQSVSAIAVQRSSAWLVHQYTFGALFALIAAHALLSLPRLWHRRHLLSRRAFGLLLSGIGVVACLRAVQLLLDAGDSSCTRAPPPVAVYLLSLLVFPSLVSCVSALVAAVVRSSGIVLPRDSRAIARALPCFVSLHLALAAAILPTAYFFAAARPLLFAYQLFTAFWGLFLWVSYVALFRVMLERAELRQLSASRTLSKSMGLSSKHAARRHRLTLVLAVRGTMCVVCSTLLHCLFETCQLVQAVLPDNDRGGGSFESTHVLSGGSWRWWALQTSARLVEAAVCLSLTYVTLLPFRAASPGTAGASADATPASAAGGGQLRRSGRGGHRLRGSSVHCREACGFYCSPCTQQCSGDDNNEYLISVPDWTRAGDSDADADCLGLHQVKRQESTKSDLYPLHLVTRSGDGVSAAVLAAAAGRGGSIPAGGGGSGTAGSTAMLAADHGKLSWKHPSTMNDTSNDLAASDGCASDISYCENPHYYHSATDVSQQPTLKVERDLADAYADLQSRSPAVAAAEAAAAAAVAAEAGSAAASSSVTSQPAEFVGGNQFIPEVQLLLPPTLPEGPAAAAESPSAVLQRVLRRTSPGRARNGAEIKCLLTVGRSGDSDDDDNADDDDISQLSVHVEEGQYDAEVEAHV